MIRSTRADLVRERNSLRLALHADPAFAHHWLCHADGSPCADGCDAAPKPARVKFYNQDPEAC